MATRKARDHRAEYLRRNALAAARGHETRAKERRLSTFEKQLPFLPTLQTRNADWSDIESKSPDSIYDPANRKAGTTVAHYDKLYNAAWVSGPQRYALNRKHGSNAIREWLVDERDWSDEDYDIPYSDK